MSDLVKQARSYGGCSEATHEVSELVHGLADRIEQLERELAKWRPLHPNPADARYWEGRFREADTELAAEKALSDRLAEDLEGYREAIDPDCKDTCCQYARETEAVLAAYRKARGL